MKPLTRNQERAVAALLSTTTIKAAAAEAGVSDVTLWRWLQDDDFASAYRAARRQIVERAVSELQAATGEAVGTLKRNMTSGHAPTEVRAAQIVLEQAIKGVEMVDLQERVERLESLLAEQEQGKAKGKRWA